MNIEELRIKRAERRNTTMAPRSVEELLALPDNAVITPLELASINRVSVETVLLNRARRKPPVGFKLGRVVRFLMSEVRSVHTQGDKAGGTGQAVA